MNSLNVKSSDVLIVLVIVLCVFSILSYIKVHNSRKKLDELVNDPLLTDVPTTAALIIIGNEMDEASKQMFAILLLSFGCLGLLFLAFGGVLSFIST
jgi:hypothetical protein